ncbi:MAG: hypothetical protein HPY85_06695 [Anaerolineae bacterium]|nr:hypothetical protein [Anaerolineae bacterium]
MKPSELQGQMKDTMRGVVEMMMTMSPLNPENSGLIQRGGRKSNTKKNFNFGKAKTRRKMAAASRKINRS